jgi:hypothetical protein
MSNELYKELKEEEKWVTAGIEPCTKVECSGKGLMVCWKI